MKKFSANLAIEINVFAGGRGAVFSPVTVARTGLQTVYRVAKQSILQTLNYEVAALYFLRYKR